MTKVSSEFFNMTADLFSDKPPAFDADKANAHPQGSVVVLPAYLGCL
jgi:hypothetical protein